MRGKPVPPVAEGVTRPFWSVIIPCYNAAQWLPESLGSVLQQDPGPDQMELMVVDDCSTAGDPEAVTRQLGGDRVRFVRQPKNVGKSRNFATGIAAASGHWIHILHADDRVDHGFYAEMRKVIEASPSAAAVFCESRYIDESGQQTGRTGVELPESGVIPEFASRLYVAQRIQTPSMVVCRSVYEQLGTFRHDLLLTEDWEMWLRIAVSFDVAFCVTTKADYRVFNANSSQRAILGGSWFADLKRLADATDDLVPRQIRDAAVKNRNEEMAIFIASCLQNLLQEQHFAVALRCIRASLFWCSNFRVQRKLASIVFRSLLASLK